jgi:mRNA interferase MazF
MFPFSNNARPDLIICGIEGGVRSVRNGLRLVDGIGSFGRETQGAPVDKPPPGQAEGARGTLNRMKRPDSIPPGLLPVFPDRSSTAGHSPARSTCGSQATLRSPAGDGELRAAGGDDTPGMTPATILRRTPVSPERRRVPGRQAKTGTMNGLLSRLMTRGTVLSRGREDRDGREVPAGTNGEKMHLIRRRARYAGAGGAQINSLMLPDDGSLHAMGRYVRGDVVLAPIRLGAMPNSKPRPAVVIAVGDDGGLLVCPVSSRERSGMSCLPLALDDFASGGLDLFEESYVITSVVLGISPSAVLAKKGRLKEGAFTLIEGRAADGTPLSGRENRG